MWGVTRRDAGSCERVSTASQLWFLTSLYTDRFEVIGRLDLEMSLASPSVTCGGGCGCSSLRRQLRVWWGPGRGRLSPRSASANSLSLVPHLVFQTTSGHLWSECAS